MASCQKNRTDEFHVIAAAATKRLARSTASAAHQRLLSAPDADGAPRPGSARGEFARRAADIAKRITQTMGKLERLAQRRLLRAPRARTR